MQGSRLDGLQLLDVFQTQHPEMPVVMISGHGNIETAVSAIRRGAYDYIEKPFKIDRLLLITQRAMEATRLKSEVEELRGRASSQSVDMVGVSASLQQARAVIEKSAPTNSRIFISGPSGSGKGLAARLIHQRSPPRRVALRRDQLLALFAGRSADRAVRPRDAGEDRHRAHRSRGAGAGAWRHALSQRGPPRCRQRRRRRCCARWSRTSSTASAAASACPSMSASFRPARRTSRT